MRDETPKGKNKSNQKINQLKTLLLKSQEGKELMDEFELDKPVELINTELLNLLPGERRSELVIEQITNSIIYDLQTGKQRLEIWKRLEKEYNLPSYKSAKKYIDRAWSIMKTMFQDEREHLKDMNYQRVLKIHDKLTEMGDWRGALLAVADLQKMYALNEQNKLSESNVTIEFRFNTADIKPPDTKPSTDYIDITNNEDPEPDPE